LPLHSHTVHPVPHFWSSRYAFEVHFTVMQHPSFIHPYCMSNVYGQLIHLFFLKIFKCERRPSYNWINRQKNIAVHTDKAILRQLFLQAIHTSSLPIMVTSWFIFNVTGYNASTLQPELHIHVLKPQFLLGASPLTQPYDGKSRNLPLCQECVCLCYVGVRV
jgi:hypothetical protein